MCVGGGWGAATRRRGQPVQTLRAEDMRPSQRRLKACLSDMDQCDTAVAFEAAHLQSIQMLIRQAPVRLGRLHQCVGEKEREGFAAPR
jgi:hypothetical protein